MVETGLSVKIPDMEKHIVDMYSGKRTLKALLFPKFDEYGDRPALSFYDSEPITYAELKGKVVALSRMLEERGITKGDQVAIIGENSPNWGITYLAITTMGAVAVPILPDFHAEDIAHIIRHSGARMIFATRRQMEKLSEVDISSAECVISLDDFEPERYPIRTSTISRLWNQAMDVIRSLPSKVGLVSTEPNEDDLAAIVYTSGTTGHSKGVMLTHYNIASNIIQIDHFFDVTPEDRILSILPISHSYENTLGFLYVIYKGAPIYYLGKKPTPRMLGMACQKVRPTVMASVPLIIEKIYKKQVVPLLSRNLLMKAMSRLPLTRKLIMKKIGRKLVDFFGGELRTMSFGGAPLSEEIELFMRECGFPYAVGYGMTEASPVVTGAKVDETRLGSVGKPLIDIEIKIVDPDENGVGEIYIKGPNVMKGYYRNKNLTAEVLTEDGWLKTGDLGYLDEDNYLYIKGRSKSLILGPSGENIFPETIEEKLNVHPFVVESLVIERDGRLEAWIYPDYEAIGDKLEGKSELEREKVMSEILKAICDEVNQKLPAYSKLSRCVEHTEPFEKTPTLKIKRYLYYKK